MKIEELEVGQIIGIKNYSQWRAEITKVFNPPIPPSDFPDDNSLVYGERLVITDTNGDCIKNENFCYQFEKWDVKEYVLVHPIPLPKEEIKPTKVKPIFEYMELLDASRRH